jgi:hypothetical protein
MTRDEDERARRDAQHDIESWARQDPARDHVTVVRIRLPEHDGTDLYALARWSLAARLIRDAAEAGRRGEITDLGPDAMDVARSIGPDDLTPGALLHVGLAAGGTWVQWFVPAPAEPVPGSPEQRGQRN